MVLPLARLAGAFVLLVALLLPGSVLAHAVLLETDPPAGAVLERAPEEIRLRFNEPVSPIRLRLFDDEQQVLAETEDARAEGNSIVLALPAALPDGGYLLSYRVRSLDTHPVGGTLVFSLGEGAAPDASELGAAEETRSRIWRWVNDSLRALQLLGLFLVAGAALFRLGVDRAEVRPLGPVFRVALPLAFAASLGAGPAYAGLVTNAAPGELLSAPVLALVASGGRALVLGFALLGLTAIALAGLPGSRPLRALLLALGVLAVLASLPPGSHLLALPEGQWLAVLLLLHGLAVAFWVGGFWPLLHSLGARGDDDERAALRLRRFSRLAVVAVGLLIFSGLVLAWFLVAPREGLVPSPYLGLLLGKLGLVILLLGLGALNKWRLTPALESGKPGARRALRRSITLEMLLGIAVLAVTAVMSQTTPPRALAQGDHDHHHAEAESGPPAFRAALYARAGLVVVELQGERLSVYASRLDGRPLEAVEAEARFARPDLDLEEIRLPLEAVSPGVYRVEGLGLPFAGDWELRLDLRINDFTQEIFRGALEVER